MKINEIYRLLEEKMLSYEDYAAVPVREIGEYLAPILRSNKLFGQNHDSEMLPFTGKSIFVRQSVLERLERAAGYLQKYDVGMRLEIGYGYRALSVQTEKYEIEKAKLAQRFTGDMLRAATHRRVAEPSVAGHPAGAAIDIQIMKNNRPLDFGTKRWEFVPDTYTFSPFVSREAWANRQLLRRVMMQAGFAPFDGEWWHFSYGDKEWARYYGQDSALYDQLEFRAHHLQLNG